MATYMIHAIQTAPNSDRIVAVEWAQYDCDKNLWLEPRAVSNVSVVIRVLDEGATVMTMVDVPGGGRVPGPVVRAVQYEDGTMGIEAANSDECVGRTLADLPRIRRI